MYNIYILLCVCLCKRGPNRNVNNHRCIMTRTVRDPSIATPPVRVRRPVVPVLPPQGIAGALLDELKDSLLDGTSCLSKGKR